MQEWPFKRSSAINSITAICLTLFTLWAVLSILSDGYQFGPSVQWEIVSDALKFGVLQLNQEAIGLSVVGYFLVGLWSLISLVLSLAAYRRNTLDEKKPLIWALVLFGVIILVIGCLLAANTTCVPRFPGGSSPVCALPLRPGASLPPG
ncbi:hypothetical protein KSC_028390 [Ktedonobacter sp. SOSP1-52]|uniref:hypothetical protein n=1 Tax=Ktedonobacter sp. SOSP1-52 TaxID=2778366 RepID=UPI0019154EAA|nr:hypothetical protein [Ktedonobacter sp. SOSP1-52]GHO63947.1 hypothetical protein KSC_028390 [Ktedonobacter sp. SOSP1-52]